MVIQQNAEKFQMFFDVISKNYNGKPMVFKFSISGSSMFDNTLFKKCKYENSDNIVRLNSIHESMCIDEVCGIAYTLSMYI